jgi:hypothetical protein
LDTKGEIMNPIKKYATNKLSKQTQKEILTNGITMLPQNKQIQELMKLSKKQLLAKIGEELKKLQTEIKNDPYSLPPKLKRYNIFLLANTHNNPVFSSNSKKATWKELGKYWGTYEVRNAKNRIIEEFIPY